MSYSPPKKFAKTLLLAQCRTDLILHFLITTHMFDVIGKMYKFTFKGSNEILDCTNIHINIKNMIPSNEEITCVQNYFKDNKMVQKHYFKTLFTIRNAFKQTYEVFTRATTFEYSL